MTSEQSKILQIREYPITLWLFSSLAILIGFYILTSSQGFVPAAIASGVIAGGLLGWSTASVMTLTIDKNQGYLTLLKQSLLRRSYLEYPLSEVATIEVESSQSSEGGQVYRVSIVLTSGELIPLRSYYSSGYQSKEKKARQLRQFASLSEPLPPAAGTAQSLRQLLHPTFELQEQGTTEAVAWRLETGALGSAPITRWISTDFTLEGEFVYLAQKPEDSPDIFGSKMLGGVTKMLFQQSLKMYGFQPEDTPSLERAQPLILADETFSAHFSIYASDASLGQRLLGPWTIHPLLNWARENPMKILQPAGQETPGQLVALYSPTGLVVACLNAVDSEQAQRLVRLGVDLVKAQGA